jgi:hypothetical protein
MNLANQIFGYLRVLRRGRLDGRRRVYWVCRCRCGVEKEIRSDALRDGGTRSCGCLQIAAVKAQGHHHPPGERFSRLVIVRQTGVIKKRGRGYLCQCDCGKRVKVQGRFLRGGLIKSCGCLYFDTRTTTIKHGQCRILHKTATYNAHQRQQHQCNNPNARQAKYFHDKGIEFRFSSFAEFYSEVGDKPHSDCWLVRIDPDGHFEVGNLRWKPIKCHRRKRRRKSK